jgi:hypothetical protein
MSPTRRPSSVAALRRGIGTPPAAEQPAAATAAPAAPRGPHTPPVRVTLNLPPELYRQLTRWADQAADQLDRPRVSVQDALRAMVRAGVADATPGSPVLEELRRER